jgi:hypothetical protein
LFIEGYKHAKGKPDERQGKMMITAVVQQSGEEPTK